MWPWAGCSDRLGHRARVLALLLAGGAGLAPARVFLTQQEALSLAFPPPLKVERRTAWLDEDRLSEAQRRAGGGVEVRGGHVPYYLGRRDGEKAVAVAYFDTHRVRTESETVMIVVDREGRIIRIEVLSCDEPKEYAARPAWLHQFEGRGLDDDLSLRRGVRPMAGATLTSRAIVEASRRVLALHSVIRPFESTAPALAPTETEPPRKAGSERP